MTHEKLETKLAELDNAITRVEVTTIAPGRVGVQVSIEEYVLREERNHAIAILDRVRTYLHERGPVGIVFEVHARGALE